MKLVLCLLVLLAGCATEAIDDKTASYNLQVLGIILGFLTTTVVPLVMLWIKSRIDKKLDLQQTELIEKTDRQTQTVVSATSQAASQAVNTVADKAAEAVLTVAAERAAEKVAEVAISHSVDSGRRDRREGDIKEKP